MATTNLKFHRIDKSKLTDTTYQFKQGEIYYVRNGSNGYGSTKICKTAGTGGTAGATGVAVFENYTGLIGASVSSSTLTITKDDGSTVTFSNTWPSAANLTIPSSYTVPSSYTAIAAGTDSIVTAISKLEAAVKGLEALLAAI